MKICKRCIMPDTRPRLVFNEKGICAACEWDDIKRTELDWDSRRHELRDLCDKIRGKNKWDCMVPASGGKDSTYVADKMKNEFNLRVLTVTITPPLETPLIQNNMANFLSHGFDNIKVTPNPEISKEINKYGFVEQGRPLLGWQSCVQSVMFRFACDFNIPLIMFGEEGETEYGGTTEMRYVPYYDTEFAIKVYVSGNDPSKYAENLDKSEMTLWMFPKKEAIEKANIKVAHWSYYENWDPYEHEMFARNNYGMDVHEGRNVGTYTEGSQCDTPLYDLHTYMMYLKFGFGRCLQDACIDVRQGRLSREEAIRLVNEYDGECPERYVDQYLDYFEMKREEFDSVIDKHVNKDLFTKVGGVWRPAFKIQ